MESVGSSLTILKYLGERTEDEIHLEWVIFCKIHAINIQEDL
jgi:hypothetical protein